MVKIDDLKTQMEELIKEYPHLKPVNTGNTSIHAHNSLIVPVAPDYFKIATIQEIDEESRDNLSKDQS